jgi:hypothetical protein
MRFPAGIKLAFAGLIGILAISIAPRSDLGFEGVRAGVHAGSGAADRGERANGGSSSGVSSGADLGSHRASLQMEMGQADRSIEDNTLHGWLPDSQDLGNGDGGASAVQSHFDAELDSALEGPASLHTAKADPAKVETSYTFHTTDPENVTAPIDKPHIATVGFQHHHAEAISQRGIIATREPQLKLKFTDGPQAATANPPHNAQRNPLRLVKKRPAEGVQTESESSRIRFLLRRFALGPGILIMLLSALSTYGVVRWMSVKCPQCGRLLERGSVACRDCGAQLMTAKPY